MEYNQSITENDTAEKWRAKQTSKRIGKLGLAALYEISLYFFPDRRFVKQNKKKTL